jgi:hypothetical protein
MSAKTYSTLEIDPSGNGTLVWQARWDGQNSIHIYRGTISEEEIVVSRLTTIQVTTTRKQINHEQFVSMATELIDEMIKNQS